MSKVPFEVFLAEQFCVFMANVKAIETKFHYVCADPEQGSKLFSGFKAMGFAQLGINGTEVNYVTCNGRRILVMLHTEGEQNKNTFHEDFIATTRDALNDLENTVLIVIHNSTLDTILTTCDDLAKNKRAYTPDTIKNAITAIVQVQQNSAVAKVLVARRANKIAQEGLSIFAFETLYAAIIDNKLRLEKEGLFDNPALLDSQNEAAIRRAIVANERIYEQVESIVTAHYDDDDILKDKLEDLHLSADFIKDHFLAGNKDKWKMLTYPQIEAEIDKNKDRTLILVDIELNGASFETWKHKSSISNAKKKHICIFIEAERESTLVKLKFRFERGEPKLVKEQVAITGDITKNLIQYDTSNHQRQSTLECALPFAGKVTFVAISLNRRSNAEQFKFTCLMVPKGIFKLANFFEKAFVHIDRSKKYLSVENENDALIIDEGMSATARLNDSDEQVNIADVGKIDFEKLVLDEKPLSFELINDEHSIAVKVVDKGDIESIKLPGIFDPLRTQTITLNERIPQYKAATRRVSIAGQEKGLSVENARLCGIEHQFITENFVFVDKTDNVELSVNELTAHHPAIAGHYKRLFEWFGSRQTLPSLTNWPDRLQALANNIVKEYLMLFDAVGEGRLSANMQALLKVGLYRDDKGLEWITPFHPLSLGYCLDLLTACAEDDSMSFKELAGVTVTRLNPAGLLPLVYEDNNGYAYAQAYNHNRLWIQWVPQKNNSFNDVKTLVVEKIDDFVRCFQMLFEVNNTAELIINSVSNQTNTVIFAGIVAYYKNARHKALPVHINLYDEQPFISAFDRFSEAEDIETAREFVGNGKPEIADEVITLLRRKVTYSKHFDINTQAYAHLAFVRNNENVTLGEASMSKARTGIACNGLLAGEASYLDHGTYYTGFGLHNVNEPNQLICLAAYFNQLLLAARKPTAQYKKNSVPVLAVKPDFKQQLQISYASSLWTCIIDPKVTLDFFDDEETILIHYADQYTSSVSYDAITVTSKKALYKRLLGHDSDELIHSFNAMNGQWLLSMVKEVGKQTNANTQKQITEKNGIVAAYKFVAALLSQSEMPWVPLSVGEMLRVAGNIGLNINENDFSAKLNGYKKGAISDDVLFVGITKNSVCLLPLEVKSREKGTDFTKAIKQVVRLASYMQQVLAPRTLKGKLFRSLFIQQVFSQVDRYQLYKVFPKEYFGPAIALREELLIGDYWISGIQDYPIGFALALNNSQVSVSIDCQLDEASQVLTTEVPMGLMESLQTTPIAQWGGKLANPQYYPKLTPYILRQPELFKVKLKSAISEAAELEETAVSPVHVFNDGTAPTPDKPQPETPIANTVPEVDEPLAVAPLVNIAPNVDAPQPAAPVASTSTSESETSENLKVLIGHNISGAAPVYWQPTNTAKFMNTNSGIIGTMGTGKTQCTKSVVTQLYRNQHHNVDGQPIGILIFDYKSDYVDEAFLIATAGKKFNLHKLPYNPLSLFGDTPMLPVHTARGFAETMGKAFGLGQKQQLKLRKLIGEAYELAGIHKADKSTWNKPAPTIADVWALFEESEPAEDSLYAALDSLNELEVFEDKNENCTSLYELVDGITVVELAGYPTEIQNLVVALTLDLFYSQMQKKGKPQVRGDFRQVTKLVLVDEADNFMSQNFASLRKILKEGREYGVGMILSTQDITHFKTSENDYSTYVLSWIVHRVGQIKNQDIKSIFNKDDKADQEQLMKTIRELDKHYSLYVDGDKKISKIKDKAFWELLNDG